MLSEYIAEAKRLGLSERTVESFNLWVPKFEKWRNGRSLEDERLLREWSDELISKGIRPVSVKLGLWNVRRYLRWLQEERGIKIAHFTRTKLPKANFAIQYTPDGASVERIILESPSLTSLPYGYIISLLASTGMRESEACKLLMEDWRVVGGSVIFLIRYPKNKRQREVPLRHLGLSAFKQYVRQVRISLLGDRESKWFFPNRSVSGHVSRKTLEMHMRIVRGKLNLPQLTTHGLRRAFVTWAMRKPPKGMGLSSDQIRKIIGHTNEKTFSRYYNPTAEDLVDMLHSDSLVTGEDNGRSE